MKKEAPKKAVVVEERGRSSRRAAAPAAPAAPVAVKKRDAKAEAKKATRENKAGKSSPVVTARPARNASPVKAALAKASIKPIKSAAPAKPIKKAAPVPERTSRSKSVAPVKKATAPVKKASAPVKAVAKAARSTSAPKKVEKKSLMVKRLASKMVEASRSTRSRSVAPSALSKRVKTKK